MFDVSNLCATFVDPGETDRVCNALAAYGVPTAENATLASGQPLKGYWDWLGKPPIFLTDADDDTAWFQAQGTCTGQGFGHGIQTQSRWSIKYGNAIGDDKLRIAWEPVYILARTVIGKNSIRDRCGACVPWLFMVGYQIGLSIRKAYGQYDLSEPKEDWAVSMSQPGAPKLPQAIVGEMGSVKLVSAFQVTDLDVAADCLAAKYALVRGADRATGSQRDADGMTGTVSSRGHCEHIAGVFIDKHGDRVWLERNSWRGTPSQPHGGGPFKLADGSEKPVPDGVGGIRDADIAYYIRGGDLWAGQVQQNLWGAEAMNPSDFARGTA